MNTRRRPVVLLIILALAAGTLGVAAVAQYRIFVPVVFREAAPTPTGTLVGRVRIGPLCPVEPCPGPPRDVYSSRQLVLQPEQGAPISVPLSSDGSFRAEVPAGTYAVTLTDCVFLGCRRALPKTVRIEAGRVTTLEIDIDTGIR